MGAVAKGINKVTGGISNTIFGGEQSSSQTQTVNVDKRSKEEQTLLDQLIKMAGQKPDTSALMPTDQDKEIQNLFKSHLSNFLSRKQDGSVDPEALKSATAFIDQTFTKPAEQQLQMAQSDYASQLGAQQAALGRSVGDSSFQENLFKSLANQRAQLGSQRGQMINDYIVNQPGRDMQTSLQGLSGVGAIQQQNAFTPTFLNQLNQQAFQNRASLLNQLSGERFSAAGKTLTGSQDTSRGLVGLLGYNSPFMDQMTKQMAAAGGSAKGGAM